MLEYLDSNNKSKCYGCRSCEQVCPVNAIVMTTDEEGFLYPEIDKEKCIDCLLCEKSCPYMNDNNTYSKDRPIVYAVMNNNEDILKSSSSGGAFSALANYVLEKNGVVVGCEYDEKFNPIHVIINNKEDMLPIRGSKYVQSDTLDTYTHVKEFLTSGTYVLYTGTPCQIAGLKCFLKHEYETLITVDLVCHGVPSNKIFHEYLSFLEKKHRGKVIDYKFRDKQKHGWASAGSYIINKQEKNIIKSTFPTNDYYYYYYYLKGDIYRESCYKCKYACSTREGYFTIADFWNIQKYHPEIYNKNGVSLVLLNNEKSKNIFNDLKFNLVYFESKLEYAVNENGNLKVPSQRPKGRDDVYQRIEKDGFKKTARKDCKLTYILPTIKRAIPASFKRKLLSLLKRNEKRK